MSHKNTRFTLNGQDITHLLHPDGRCTCHDIPGPEDPPPCDYCRTHCLFCGARESEHPVTEAYLAAIGMPDETPHDFEPMKKDENGTSR